ncbi:MAG: DeoR/GlpR family DNA-binding transcription regulator [Christensenellales bacterium]
MKLGRLNAIEQYILTKGFASIDELCDLFHVSKNTVRRDLGELESRKTISKVYGGVTANTKLDVAPIPIRRTQGTDAKALIGSMAAKYVDDGDTIFIDAGTTTVNLIGNIVHKRNVTLISHSMLALSEATKFRNLSLISLGGFFNHDTSSFFGISTFENLKELRINKAFLGCTGVTLDAGVTNITYFESEIKHGIVARSTNVILMSDSTKIGKIGMISVCPLSRLNAFVTDLKPSAEYIDYCAANGIDLVYKE